jgi:predicted nucleic acid-binding protein
VGQALIVDAGPLVAMIDADDRYHDECRELLETHPGTTRVPQLVVAEVAYFVARRLGTAAEVRFIGDLASGTFTPEPVEPQDWLRIAELVAKYRDLPLGTVDASVVAAAERLNEPEVATLDRRHFAVVRPTHVPALTLLP